MNRFINTDDHVLPRPVERLPEYAHARARRALAEKLVSAFGHSEAAAAAMADALVDPSVVRRNIGEVNEPQVEEIRVPGGTLLGIRTEVWVRRVFPDPRNPRIGPARRHPFAVAPGAGGEDSRFRPVPEPRSPEDGERDVPELVVDIESRDHLEWASAQAAKYVLAENDWRISIASQGVMEAVWLVPTTYRHEDGSAPATVLTTVEGSSRTSAVHDLLSIRSADIPYEDDDQRLRVRYRKLNDALQRGPEPGDLVALRCERIPALILVGFRRQGDYAAKFPTAVKSLVALRHVDPPKPWGEGPENESLADEVLDELYRQSLISATERAYFAASCTKAEARAAHLSDDPTHRAARIVELFTTNDERTKEAIRVAVTSQSTRKRISTKLLNELATALIVRSVSDPSKVDRVRLYMRHAYGQAVHRDSWTSTGRDTDSLAKAAFDEARRSITDPPGTEPGPASLELAARAAYALIVDGALTANLGSAEKTQDRRAPGELLDVMRRKEQGIHQLAQALRDFSVDQRIRAVDSNGNVRKRADGSGDQVVTDTYLREEFPPRGKVLARSSGTTPTELLKSRLAGFSEAMDGLEVAFEAVIKVTGRDGESLIEADGADPQLCTDWRDVLTRIGDDLAYWGRRFRQRHGNLSGQTLPVDLEDSEDGADDDESALSLAELDDLGQIADEDLGVAEPLVMLDREQEGVTK